MSVGATLIPTGVDFDQSVELRGKSIMEMLEAVKTILEIIVIFITFPQYAPILASIAVLGAISHYLLRGEDKNDREDKPTSKHISVTDIPPEVKQ